MRVGVTGVGRIGRPHAERLAANPDVSAVVLHDINATLASAVAADLDMQAVADLDALLSSVDALVIAAITTAHADLLSAAVEARVPVMCEKPISHDLERARDIVRRVHALNVPVLMGFQRRFDAGYQAARDLVASGGLGTLYTFRTVGHDPEPASESYIAGSGGMFRDFGVHDFDALRFVTNQEIARVYADATVRAFSVYERYDDADTAVATLTLSDGALGLASYTRHDPLGYDVRMELFGSRDSVVVGWDDQAPLRSLEPNGAPLHPTPHATFHDRFADAYAAEIATFLDVARGRMSSPSTVDDALEALRVAVACNLSVRECRPVDLSEIP